MFAALRSALVLACFCLIGAAIPARAQVMESVATFDVLSLKPGQYVWFDEAQATPASYQADGPIVIVVSIPQQLAYVYRGDALVAVSTVSTGREGHETPTGDFEILQKQRFHRSNLYSNAPMPFMQRLTWDGIALHSGHLPGYPASHGCIRLPDAFARQLFQLTAVGGRVSVIDEEVMDPRLNVTMPPQLVADTRGLGGEAFNFVTIGTDRPPPLVPVRDDGTRRPTSWVTGPTTEVVQPTPPGRNP